MPPSSFDRSAELTYFGRQLSPKPSEFPMLSRLPRRDVISLAINWDVDVLRSGERVLHVTSLVPIVEEQKLSNGTIYWMSLSGYEAQINAERCLKKDIELLNRKVDLIAETAVWRALEGNPNIASYNGIGYGTNFGFREDHKVTPRLSWFQDIRQMATDLTSWRRLLVLHSRTEPKEVYLNGETMRDILDLHEGQKEQLPKNLRLRPEDIADYLDTGVLNFLGLRWNVLTDRFQTRNWKLPLLRHNELFLGNWDENNPLEIFQGPVWDQAAPANYTGKFVKLHTPEDALVPVAVSMEWHMLPILARPEQFIHATGLFYGQTSKPSYVKLQA